MPPHRAREALQAAGGARWRWGTFASLDVMLCAIALRFLLASMVYTPVYQIALIFKTDEAYVRKVIHAYASSVSKA